jgi:Zn-dependent protease
MKIPGSIKVGRIAGIPILVHISLPIAALILAVYHQEVVLLPLIVVLALCILLHEMGHSLVGIRKNCDIRQILLTPIGGIAQIASPSPLSPKDEAQVAIAGPLVSLALALFFGIIGGIAFIMGIPLIPLYILPVAAANLIFFLFNLLPAFPMDGGRVLRAWLTPRKGRLEATRLAMNTGRVFAGVFFLVGLFKGHIGLMFIAFFVYFTAGFEYRLLKAHDFMHGPLHERPEDQDGLIVGPAPYDTGQASTDHRLGIWRETRTAARILIEEFSRLHKV